MKRRIIAKASVAALIPLSGCFAYTVPGNLNLDVSVNAPNGVEYQHVDDSVNRGLVDGLGSVTGEILVESGDIKSMNFQASFYDEDSQVDSITRTLAADSESFEIDHVEEVHMNLTSDTEPTRYEVTLIVDRV